MPTQPMRLEREQSRITALKVRNAERVSRFLNHKQRTMGIDVEAIGQQVRENKEKIATEKRESIEEDNRQAHIMQALEARNKERDELRRQEAARLRSDWQAEKKEKDQRNLSEKELRRQPIDKNVYGISSAQTFSGEGLGCKERIKKQQMQLRQWAAEQQKFNAELKAIEAEEETRHIDMDTVVRQQQLEFGNCTNAVTLNYRKAQNKEVLQDNTRLAEEKAMREKLWRVMQADEEKMELQVREEALKEVKGKASNDATGRMMSDRFKGLTDAEIKTIYHENQKVHEEYLMRKDAEVAAEREWAISEEAIVRQREAAEAERAAAHTSDLLTVQEHLKAQREEAKLKHLKSKADRLGMARATETSFNLTPPSKISDICPRFGRILPSEGIYAGFEASCRQLT